MSHEDITGMVTTIQECEQHLTLMIEANRMDVKVKNLPLNLVFGEYNGQLCAVVEEFHSKQYGTSLRVRAADGREFTVGPAQYETTTEDANRFAARVRSQPKQFVAPGLRRIQRYSARCTT